MTLRMLSTRSCSLPVLAFVLVACADATEPRATRRFEIASVNGNASLEVACPPPSAGGDAGVGFARPVRLELQGNGRFTWTFTVGAWATDGGLGEVRSLTTVEEGMYRVRRDSLLLTFSVGMPLTDSVGSIHDEAVELFVRQSCITDPELPAAPLRVRLEEVTTD